MILLNGHDPDPLRAATPGADIVFVPDLTDFPTDVTASLSCP